MQRTKVKTGVLGWLMSAAVVCSGALVSQALAATPAVSPATAPSAKEQPLPPLTAERFDKLHRMIKPQPGELRFQEIPWLLSVWEARKMAAAEGKPILVWSGSGGSPTGVC